MLGYYRRDVVLFLHLMAFMFLAAWCYDPCPESLRKSSAAKPCNIPDSEVQKAVQEAKTRAKNINEQEKKLVRQGRVVNKKIKSPESTHPQAYSPAYIRQRELRQRTLQEASMILAKKYNLTPSEVSCGLPRTAQRDPTVQSAIQDCANDQSIQCDASAIYRTADGTCNNLENPTWGSAGTCFDRILPAVYRTAEEGDRPRTSVVDGQDLPSPRTVSTNMHPHQNWPTNYINQLFMCWGQFLDHDITLTTASTNENQAAIECCPVRNDNHPQCAPIMLPANDPFYSKYNITCLNFVRSALCPYCTMGPRAQVNQLTSYIDASQVYGNSVNETTSLRDPQRMSRLAVQYDSVGGEILPPSPDPQNDFCSVPERNLTCFLAGDPRVNQQYFLTVLHTMFLREHNRIEDVLASLNPSWTAERLFQEVRKIIGAMMQVITYKEYLPTTIGNDRMTYFGLWLDKANSRYDPSMDPSLMTEFSTFAFRFGHTLIGSFFGESSSGCPHKGHYLKDIFFQPWDLYYGATHCFLKGATCSAAQAFDRYLIPDVTTFLYRTPDNATGFDLASFNVQRGRDHGIAPYHQYVRYCSNGEINIQTFDDLERYRLMTRDSINALIRTYRSAQDIDAWTGMISEIYSPGAVTGPTGRCIMGLQFQRLKYGDRFYFQHGGLPNSFTTGQIDALKKTCLSSVICRNNPQITEMQRNAFLFASDRNPLTPCNQFYTLDLTQWRE